MLLFFRQAVNSCLSEKYCGLLSAGAPENQGPFSFASVAKISFGRCFML
ncbi:hypothetical protein DESHY_110162 [Desulforamulus hydrothermalis Lam5 = DSM 18033]|uniref:Uncharacterized protein n=1 Tax=Desulforamulus hydrothermalis Lam5 = DSM 18033 TaxID=1121428 RepID=K8E6W5_9FIRM|nr:hypothetical protein DESHY_110162 [Desulforamulus hydrothermalis Lam5 = DSM 18033]